MFSIPANFRNGCFQLGDEIINVNGVSVRGMAMREVRSILTTSSPHIDITIARDEHPTHIIPRLDKSISVRTRRAEPVIQRSRIENRQTNVVMERTIVSDKHSNSPNNDSKMKEYIPISMCTMSDL